MRVRPLWRPIFVGAVPLALALAGCGKPDKPPPKAAPVASKATAGSADGEGEVLARIGDVTITREQFEDQLNQQTPFARSRLHSDERKREFLENLIRFELLAMDAEEKGFDTHPDVVLARKQAMVRTFMAEELRDRVKVSDITDADIAAHYEENKAEYARPPQVRGAHILIADQEKAERLLAELKGAIERDRFKAREIFAEYARRHSVDDATRETGGDLKFFGKPGDRQVKRRPTDPPVAPPVAQAIFDLVAVGDVAPALVQSSAGWHLVQKTGFRRAYTRTLKDVEASIRNKLFRARKASSMDTYVTELKKAAKIEVNESVLEKVEARRVQPVNGGLRPPDLKRLQAIDPSKPPPAPGLAPVPGLQKKIRPHPKKLPRSLQRPLRGSNKTADRARAVRHK